MKPRDLVFWRDEKFGIHRFWEIESVSLGGTGQESLITMRSLTATPGRDAEGVEHDVVTVPEPLVRGKVYSLEAM